VHAASSSPPSLTHVHRCIGSRNATGQTLATSVKLTYLRVYDRRNGVSEYTVSPSPPSSLTDVHRCIGSHNATRQTLSTSPKLTHLSEYDNRDVVSEHTASPSPPSSLTDVHRCIGSRNSTRQMLPTSVKLTSLSTYDNRDGKYVRQQRWRFWVRSFPVAPLLAHACTQVHRRHCLPLRNWRLSVLMTQPSVCERCRFLNFSCWVFHHTDPHVYVWLIPDTLCDKVDTCMLNQL
jgi:hypothetical protein